MPTASDIQVFQFDPTGTLAANKIVNEQHILTPGTSPNFHFIVPTFAPYFVNSTLKVTFQPVDGAAYDLVEGIHYYCTHVFHDASLATAHKVAGSISFIDYQLTGVVQLQYQTLGGIWTIDEEAISRILADRLHNPRITTWEQVTNQPVTFPVIDHPWNLVDLVGMSEVVDAIKGIEAALRATGDTGLAAHLADYDNPHHVDKSQVGLALVQNFGIATTADAQGGLRDDVYMTPLKVGQAMATLPSPPLQAHIADHNNPHQVNKADVGLGNVPNFGLASVTDAQNGTRDDVFMTPSKVATQLNNGFGQDLAEHEADQTNPHRVTAAQVGAYTKAEMDLALDNKLGKTEQATDSAAVNGMTAQQIIDAVNGGQAADSALFGGKTPAQYKEDVLTGTAADANKLGGKSYNELLTAIAGDIGASQNATYQDSFDQVDGETAGDFWLEVGNQVMLGAGQPNDQGDAVWIVSGADSHGLRVSGAYMVQLNTRDAGGVPKVQVRNMLADDSGLEFGYAIDSTGPNPIARVYVKTQENIGGTTVTALSRSGAVASEPARLTAAPAGYTPVTTLQYVTSDQLSTVVTTMTAAIQAIADTVNS